MAPEQVEGKDADARADIWAFGAVLYEMLTGSLAFVGDSSAAVVGAILKDRPLPLSTRRSDAPAALDPLVRGCLEKDSEERWQSAADVARQLRGVTPGVSGQLVTHERRSSLTRLLPWAVAGLAAAAAAVTLVSQRPAEPPKPVYASIELPDGYVLGEDTVGVGCTSRPPGCEFSSQHRPRGELARCARRARRSMKAARGS